MLRTIMIGSCVFVQGIYVRNMTDGTVVVRVDERLFVGRPVSQ